MPRPCLKSLLWASKANKVELMSCHWEELHLTASPLKFFKELSSLLALSKFPPSYIFPVRVHMAYTLSLPPSWLLWCTTTLRFHILHWYVNFVEFEIAAANPVTTRLSSPPILFPSSKTCALFFSPSVLRLCQWLGKRELTSFVICLPI